MPFVAHPNAGAGLTALYSFKLQVKFEPFCLRNTWGFIL